MKFKKKFRLNDFKSYSFKKGQDMVRKCEELTFLYIWKELTSGRQKGIQ